MNDAAVMERVGELRRQGKTRPEIMRMLGITEWGLNAALRNQPLRAGATRPRAKDDLRDKARELRLQGLGYDEIVARLGVSKSSVSLWVRDLPAPERVSKPAVRRPAAKGTRRRLQGPPRPRPSTVAQRAAACGAARAEIGQLTSREILIGGAIVYWCEGAKNKPHRRYDRVSFVNSDPGLVRFFLRFLDLVGVPLTRLRLSLAIHEGADADAALAFWRTVTGAGPELFNKTVIKPVKPKIGRKNTGADYRGCLRIDVRNSSDLYRKIEGWVAAATLADWPALPASEPKDLPALEMT